MQSPNPNDDDDDLFTLSLSWNPTRASNLPTLIMQPQPQNPFINPRLEESSKFEMDKPSTTTWMLLLITCKQMLMYPLLCRVLAAAMEGAKPSLRPSPGPRTAAPRSRPESTSWRTRFWKSGGTWSAGCARESTWWFLIWRASFPNCGASFRRKRRACMIGHPAFGWNLCFQDAITADKKTASNPPLQRLRKRPLIGCSCC